MTNFPSDLMLEIYWMKKYSVHGFYFSLDGYMPTQLYESPGDPTTYGIELDYKF